jgi:hypothetical protein
MPVFGNRQCPASMECFRAAPAVGLKRVRFRDAINIGQLMLRRPVESWVGADGGVDNEIPSTAHTTLS